MKDSDQPAEPSKKFKLGHLGNLNQVIVALGKTIRAMADGSLDTQDGARICNGLGIMRACLELQKLERLESRMDEIAGRLAQGATANETITHETPRLPTEAPHLEASGEIRPS
jgi:hypothetical protein